MKLIVGLGNPTSQYQNTRHNFGFLALEAFAEHRHLDFIPDKKFKGDVTYFSHPLHEKVFLLKPQTYMNLSGESVQKISAFYKIEPKDILVMHDELDLPFGQWRFAFSGSPAGHNGLKSIIELLGTPEFYRFKLGIGRPTHPGQSVSTFVLEKFSESESKQAHKLKDRATEALDFWLENPFSATQNRYNQKM